MLEAQVEMESKSAVSQGNSVVSQELRWKKNTRNQCARPMSRKTRSHKHAAPPQCLSNDYKPSCNATSSDIQSLEDTMHDDAPRRRSSASATSRATRSLHVGTSLIKPMDWLQDHMLSFQSPVS